MTIIANWNGKNVKLDELKIPIEDRAYFFGDGVYEVISIYNEKSFLFDEHLTRLERSLDAIKIRTKENFRAAIEKNIHDNNLTSGMVYVQVSRGTAPRVHSFHQLEISPNILIYSKSAAGLTPEAEFQKGIKAITHDDIRWGRCDIKSLNLLANCMAQSLAYERGAKEAIFIHPQLGLTEGSSSNVFLVKDKCFYTPPLSKQILPGTVRNHLIKLLKEHQHPIIEKPLTKTDLLAADEVFITSTTREALGVIAVDEQAIGNGQVGSLTRLARELIQATYL